MISAQREPTRAGMLRVSRRDFYNCVSLSFEPIPVWFIFAHPAKDTLVFWMTEIIFIFLVNVFLCIWFLQTISFLYLWWRWKLKLFEHLRKIPFTWDNLCQKHYLRIFKHPAWGWSQFKKLASKQYRIASNLIFKTLEYNFQYFW